MSGLGEMGGKYAANVNAWQTSQKDIDQYDFIAVDSPSVTAAWYGSASGTVTASTAITRTNALADWPRNVLYSITGITNGTYGGTFTANLIDQFGVPATEIVAIPAAVNGGSVFGTAIAMKFVSANFISQGSAGTFIGTANVGMGTIENGSAQSNWFGLLTKIGGTADVKNITWISTNTVTTLNGGTAIGTLVNTTLNAFQGTSGVQVTDHYRVIMKPTFDNTGRGTMSNL